MNLAYALASIGIMVWLDLLALPRARALNLIQKDKAKLEKLIQFGFGQCACILAIDSMNYGKRSRKSAANWTMKEWDSDLISGRQLTRIGYKPSGGASGLVTASADVFLRSKTPDGAAKELSKWLEAHPI